MVEVRVGAPVGQGHAVEQACQSWVDAEAPGAEGPVPVRLAPAPVHRVEVVLQRGPASPPARRQVAVGRRHHEVSAVDDLRAGQRAAGGSGTGDPAGFSVRLGVRVREVLQVVPSGGRASASTRHCVLSTFYSGHRPSDRLNFLLSRASDRPINGAQQRPHRSGEATACPSEGPLLSPSIHLSRLRPLHSTTPVRSSTFHDLFKVTASQHVVNSKIGLMSLSVRQLL